MEITALSESLVIGSGFIDWINGLASNVSSTIGTLLGIAGVVLAIIIIAKNPTVGRVIIGVLIGAFAASLPWLIPAVGEMVRGDVEGSGAGTSPYAFVVVEEEVPTSALES